MVRNRFITTTVSNGEINLSTLRDLGETHLDWDDDDSVPFGLDPREVEEGTDGLSPQ